MHTNGALFAKKKISTMVVLCEGSATRAADATCYARAGKTTTECEGGRKKRPMVWCIERVDIIAKSCYIRRSDCPGLCSVLVSDVTF